MKPLVPVVHVQAFPALPVQGVPSPQLLFQVFIVRAEPFFLHTPWQIRPDPP